MPSHKRPSDSRRSHDDDSHDDSLPPPPSGGDGGDGGADGTLHLEIFLRAGKEMRDNEFDLVLVH